MMGGERLSQVTVNDLLRRPVKRRTLVLGGLAAVGALTGCDGGQPQPAPSWIENSPIGSGIEAVVYPLESSTRIVAGQERTILVDKPLEEKPKDGLEQVVFFYNPKYEGGSIAVALSFSDERPSLFRVVSKEMSPRPGYLWDKEYPVADELTNGEPVIKHPVIELAPGDQEVVFLATGKTPAETQQMRAYAIGTTDGRTLEGSFNGYATLVPPLKMRE